MKTSFYQASYLSQVRRLRKMAQKALLAYPLQVKKIKFINHGENTTFRIYAKNRKSYLLRIHRNNYHTKPEIAEETAWLKHLAQKGLSVPEPVLSKNKNLVETVEVSEVGARNCSVQKWVYGGFVRQSVKPHHLFQVGQILGSFQNNMPRTKTQHRLYWAAEGLVGRAPKFGSIDKLVSIAPKKQKTLTKARKTVFKKLKHFENKFPDKLGLIHADLHVGNIVSTKNGLGAIDFDNCGWGFLAYDLAIPYLSTQNLLGDKKKKLLPKYKKALIDGYKTERRWDHFDEEIFSYLVVARKLLMLGWLNSRSDNPRLKKHLKGAVKNALLYLKRMT